MDLARRILWRVPGVVPKFYPFSLNTLSTVSSSPGGSLSSELEVPVGTKLSKTDSLKSEESTKDVISKPETSDRALDRLYSLVELELRGNDKAVLKSFEKFAVTVGNQFEIESKAWSLRKPHHERLTLLKSVHIYKKHRVQYEFRTYFSFVQYKKVTESTADTLLEYIERNLPEGVALKATKVEIQQYPEHILPPK